MRERSYWYLGALILLVAGALLTWWDPFAVHGCGSIPPRSICDNPGVHHAIGPIFGIIGVFGGLLLVAAGTLRDPPD